MKSQQRVCTMQGKWNNVIKAKFLKGAAFKMD